MATSTQAVAKVAQAVPARETAAQAYARHQAAIVGYATRLAAALDGHLEGETVHWGHVGDLAHVEEVLAQAVNFLEGNDY